MAGVVIHMQNGTQAQAQAGWQVWRRWVLANAAGELVGLGLAFLLGGSVHIFITSTFSWLAGLALPVAMVISGTFEGVIVGFAQWLVLRRVLVRLQWQTWVVATAAGAFLAWVLGMLPSTLMNSGSDDAAGAMAQMSDSIIYLLAAGLGIVAGAILGMPQWLVLRRYVHNAAWWVAANSVAWMAGMVLIFAGTSTIPPEGITPQAAAVLLLAIVAAGITVGAIHGLALVRLLRHRK